MVEVRVHSVLHVRGGRQEAVDVGQVHEDLDQASGDHLVRPLEEREGAAQPHRRREVQVGRLDRLQLDGALDVLAQPAAQRDADRLVSVSVVVLRHLERHLAALLGGEQWLQRPLKQQRYVFCVRLAHLVR